MTKKEALQKIEELKQFVADLDKEPAYKHGDLLVMDSTKEKRLVVDTESLILHIRYGRYHLLNEYGVSMNGFGDGERVGAYYTKIKNVFEN